LITGQAETLDEAREWDRVKDWYTGMGVPQAEAARRSWQDQLSGGMTDRARFCAPGTVAYPLTDLLRHMEKHYTVYQLRNDLDCVLDCCGSDGDCKEVRRYARARLAGGTYRSSVVTVVAQPCEVCRKTFSARRSTARFCSSRCRLRAARQAA
jgi:hypothetical protein